MKKMLIMLVLVMAVVANAAAQMVVRETPVTFTLVNGYVYDRTHVPGGTWVRAGEDVNSGINRYFMDLRRRNQAEAQRQYNVWIMNGGLNGITPVDIVSTTVMGGGMMMGGAGMMVGTGGAGMGGMVMGSGGMAGANSNVIIDNQNMMSTVGSGLQMYYDTGSNSLSVSGDPLMAAGRLFSFIGGSKKRQQTTNNANNGNNVRVIYVDAATGQEVAAPRSNTRSTATTPTTTTRTTTTTTTRSTNNAANYSGYNFASGF